MAICEAMARGLPLVASTGGAAAETVPDGAGLKVPPGDGAALRRALRHLLSDELLRRSLGEAAWQAGRTLPSWDETAARIVSVLCAAGAAA
jgi:glycosyltransferase involved in cell wall biosynthesis